MYIFIFREIDMQFFYVWKICNNFSCPLLLSIEKNLFGAIIHKFFALL